MEATQKMEKVMSNYDVSLLVGLIERNPIIRSKETNATTNRTKDDAWTSLAHEFNARSKSVTLTKEQLQLKWDDLKKWAGKRPPRIQLNNLKTAGGGGKPGFNTSNELLDNVTGPLRPSRTRFVAPFVGEGSADGQLIVGDLGETGNGLEDNITPEETSCHIAKDHQVTESPIKGAKLAREAVADSIITRNLAEASYYDRKKEKINLEIKLLELRLSQGE
ncbi:uncharacterized protein LOC110374612 [Helicoverpa armigera]|uniref:uncharacterized protein LOC110374612 n=1 Tax=Helicoverpa armigera TaxID=29058 RepID=UPI0030830139